MTRTVRCGARFLVAREGMSHSRAVPQALELWGGIEATVNRVGESYVDQLATSGHATRPDDLQRLAQLGLRTVRYPVLWERTAPRPDEAPDWRWADERLGMLRDLGIVPIVGFVHHGSGPRHTDLLDPGFASGVAAFAAAFAERYPWITHYTPVNEPLTTARFSALYGVWYPHRQDETSFVRALVHQLHAVVDAMRAIRRVNPDAVLVQTEDIGSASSTSRLAYQAEHENHRRWLTFDLLCGRVDHQHPLWERLRACGFSDEDAAAFSGEPCPPDILGINYYVTSDRYLDHRLAHYPSRLEGGNDRDRYVDVEAVRACAAGIAGHARVLEATWERYERPLAITECHLGCTREEQLRWLHEAWVAARTVRMTGVDVRAVTVWSLFGASDWDSLVTRQDGHYEPGAFDTRAPAPRPTAVAEATRLLAATGDFSHPVLDVPGWWRRDERLTYSAPGDLYTPWQPTRVTHIAERGQWAWQAAPLLITGATGTLGGACARLCASRGLPHRLLSRRDMDIADPMAVARTLEEIGPWAVINTAGYVRVDDAEDDEARCARENTDGPGVLAAACARLGIPLVTFSSDLVFDGRAARPYVESDGPAPLNAYGRSKAEGERIVLATHPQALIVRTSAFFGPWDAHNFLTLALEALAAGRPLVAADDQVVSPTYVPDLVHATLDLLIDGAVGVWHLANRDAVTWAGFARQAAQLAGLPVDLVQGRSTSSLELRAARPRFSALASERGWIMPTLADAVERFLHHRERVLERTASVAAQPQERGGM
jgi:dTDP-4-dehydrorhamnose reductase